MEIKIAAVAGTMESSDAMVQIEPREQSGIVIDLRSSVERQYGAQIKKKVLETVEQLGVNAAAISIVDKGALDCTIQARVTTAVYRAAQITSYDWRCNKV